MYEQISFLLREKCDSINPLWRLNGVLLTYDDIQEVASKISQEVEDEIQEEKDKITEGMDQICYVIKSNTREIENLVSNETVLKEFQDVCHSISDKVDNIVTEVTSLERKLDSI